MESFDDVLDKHLPTEEKSEIRRILYGATTPPLSVPKEVADFATSRSFDLKAFKFPCREEAVRTPRIVRLGLIQNAIPSPTTSPILEQQKALYDRILALLEAAHFMGVNIACLQEAWTCPFFMCTREREPWLNFAESAEDGPSTRLLSRVAQKYNMVIVSPILERDEKHGDVIYNTAVVIGNNGNVIGKQRKVHIPRVGDFNESTYYLEGDSGFPTFETVFGKIAVNICYGRHHPLEWMAHGLNGAEIVFNPSATVGNLSEPMWGVEGRNAAIANSYYVASINRVGTEKYPNEFTSGDGKTAHSDFGHFYGSSYVSAPNASRCPSLSRVKDGLLVAEVDLNLCRQVKDMWMLRSTARYDLYADLLRRYVRSDFEPQIVRDPSLPSSSVAAKKSDE